MAKVTISELAGSYDQNYFAQGLLLASPCKSLGEIWEQQVTCTRCLFAKSCGLLHEQMEARGQNPQCSQVVDILLGTLSPDDECIDSLSEWEDSDNDEED